MALCAREESLLVEPLRAAERTARTFGDAALKVTRDRRFRHAEPLSERRLAALSEERDVVFGRKRRISVRRSSARCLRTAL